MDYFIQKRQHQAGKETLLKLGDKEKLMELHVQLEKWEEANLLGKSDPTLRSIMLLPYAEHLAKNNKFQEAQLYYKEAGRPDLALQIMERLSKISLVQKKYDQCSYFFWMLARENLREVMNFKQPSETDSIEISKFTRFVQNSYIYRAYDAVIDYLQRPLKLEKYPGYNKTVYNSARAILGLTQDKKFDGIELALVNYVFAKTSVKLGGRKAARVALDKLNQYVIKDEWVEELEIENLKARGLKKPESKETIYRCYRCGNTSEVIAGNHICGNCHHPMVLSPLSFANLPLVEFEVVGGISHE